MIGDNVELDQQVIHNNLEIFGRIEKELLDAQSEILVAAAWFTDPDLLNILLKKLGDGVKVELIIADNKENEKLDFQQLVLKGASVLKIKNVGYGMMHQKFCVIDKRIALHGSFNWSVNAKKNNHESIIATNHKATVNSLVANFHDIKQKAFDLKAEPEKQNIKDWLSGVFGRNQKNAPPAGEKQTKSQNSSYDFPPLEEKMREEPTSGDSKSEYERVLDSMIAAEVSHFDRSILRGQGYERARSNNGDHKVLTTALDSVYSVFINDINVVEDKKIRLTAKIEDQKAKSTGALKEGLDLKLQKTEKECQISEENLSGKIANLKAQVSINDKEIDGIKNIKIPGVKGQIGLAEGKIKEEEREFVKPAFRWFEFIPITFLNLGLFLYLVFFYSSAAYILFFSEIDANLKDKSGVEVEPAEVFNPEAISNAAEKGFTAIFFIFLFVFLPLAFALARRYTTKQWLSYLGMVVVDFAVAYKVAESIHNVNLLAGKVDGDWQFSMAPQSANFWLVFVLGAGGLLFFSYVFDKFMSFFEERNPDIASVKSRVLVNQLKKEVLVYEKTISDFQAEIENLEKLNIQYRTEILICEAELDSLPGKKLSLIEAIRTEFGNKVQHIDITTAIYKSHIENDNLPISVDSMKDRINVFLEGWNDYLHDEYSVIKAVEKSGLAAQTVAEWQIVKLNKNSVDSRIKF